MHYLLNQLDVKQELIHEDAEEMIEFTGFEHTMAAKYDTEEQLEKELLDEDAAVRIYAIYEGFVQD